MNTYSRHPRRSRIRGILLIECIVYFALFFLIMGLATAALYHCMSSAKALRRNADDISRCLQAGERWRAEVRAATGRIQSGPDAFRIPGASGDVVYTVRNSQLLRADSGRAPVVMLPNVKASEMTAEPGANATVCRWELELAPSRAQTRMAALFTFAAASNEH